MGGAEYSFGGSQGGKESVAARSVDFGPVLTSLQVREADICGCAKQVDLSECGARET